MVAKNIKNKVSIGKKILAEQGFLGFAITSLQYAQKKTNKHAKHIIDTRAIYKDILLADPSKPVNQHWKGTNKKKLTINWLMPPPGKGSGGHMTLFRFIKYTENAGHTCRIYFFKPGPDSTIADVRNAMGDSFPKVKAKMAWLKENDEMKDADVIFATSWETAYTVYRSKVAAKKMYFVQDFEPYFYPVGSFSVLAENTYKLGFYGITAGGWLAKKLHDDYGMQTNHFNFGSDSSIYTYDQEENRDGIVYYARPTTERRAFELGILSLDLFHKLHPEYKIYFIGWDVSDYEIPFPHENLGILTPLELNSLYNRCKASLVMSLTNMSLLPLELLSSGCIPVVTKGENNTLVSDNQYIRYSDINPLALSKTLSDIVTNKNIDKISMAASKSASLANWDESGKKFVKIVESAVKLKN